MYTVTNNDDLNKLIFKNKDKIILLYFGAEWCGPCKKLKENFKNDDLMNQYDKLCVIYLDVDLDTMNNMCEIYEVEALPTQWFLLFKDFSMERLHKIVGFNWEELNNTYLQSLELLNDLNQKTINSDKSNVTNESNDFNESNDSNESNESNDLVD